MATVPGRWLIVAASVVSGVGHILAGATARGLGLFFVFIMAANGIIIGAILWQEPETARRILVVSVLAAAAVWIFGLVDCYRLVIIRHRPDRLEERARRFRAGVMHYLRDEYGPAREAFLAVLESYPEDVDAGFYSACADAGLGEVHRARVALKRLAPVDEAGKWAWESKRLIEEWKEAKS